MQRKYISFHLQTEKPDALKKKLCEYNKDNNPKAVQRCINAHLGYYNEQIEKIRSNFSSSLVIYRVKTPKSILEKTLIQENNELLPPPSSRHSKVDIYPFYDIYSIKIVVSDLEQIARDVIPFIQEKYFETMPRANYIESPRETGYQALHIVARPKDVDVFVPVIDFHIQDKEMFNRNMFDDYHSNKIKYIGVREARKHG
jgi:ppGpp synthetase/RelA/SpoT-type nucleotidyltranferase